MSLDAYGHLALDDYSQPAIAIPYLAALLKRRELSLILGAGVSDDAALPNWETLVSGCERAVGITPQKDRTAPQLMEAMDAVRREIDDEARLLPLIRESLYTAEQLDTGTYPTDLVQSKMLIALGAMIMASARGSVTDVITMNFDDLLEWYLALHGYRTQVVTDLPIYLRGDVDVTVFHPHGFVPLVAGKERGSRQVVFSHSEFIQRLASTEGPWPTMLNNLFMTRRFLAIGTSMNDIDIAVHLQRARNLGVGPGPLGFVVTAHASSDRQKQLRDLGLAPVVLPSYEQIPDFLLSICQAAAA